MQKNLNILALTVGMSLVAAVSARAQLIASENFGGYTTGADVLGDGTAGNGWANSWADKNSLDVVEAGALLSYTDADGNVLTTSGNTLLSNGASNPATSSSEPERTLTGTIGTLALANTADPDTVWMSYLWQGGNTSGSSASYRQATLMFLKGASTTSTSPGGTEYMDIGMPNISAGTVGTVLPNISLWASSGNAGQTTTSTAPLQSTVAANDGNTDFMLIEMTGTAAAWGAAGNAETLNVWINPILGGTLGTPTLSYSLQDLSTLNAIRVQGGGYNATYGTLPGEESVGDINFGDTVGDVETFTPGAVPEPGSMALAALGGLGLLVLKRKR